MVKCPRQYGGFAMANSGSIFPAIIRAEYQGGNAFPAFASDIDRATRQAREKFDSSFASIKSTVENALGKAGASIGNLDLGVKQSNEAAAAAQRRADALREIARAARAAADAERNVPALEIQAKAASAAAIEARQFAKDAAQQTLALDRLQVELDHAAASTRKFSTAQSGASFASAASRQAYVGVGQQLHDLVISIGSGQRASTVLAQQLPQLAFAMSGVGGAAGRVATILSGPWGIALAAGAFALGPLIDGLFKTAKAADDVRFATNALGDAQSILGNVLDIATGKITTQSGALLGLAKAQLLVARVQAQTRAADARRGVQDIQYRETQFSGGLGGGFSLKRRPVDARDAISKDVLAGTLDSSTAVERLENLRRIGKLTDDQFAAAATSVANLGVELQNVKVFDEAEKLLNRTGGRSILKPTKKTGSTRKTGSDKSAALAEFGEDVGSKIANIADRFGDAPSAVARMNAALRELDDVQSDLERRKPPKLDTLLAQLSEARSIVGNSLSTAFDKLIEKEQDRARIADLIAQGREREAMIAEKLASLGDIAVAAQVDQLREQVKVAQEILATEDATAGERAKATGELEKANAQLAKIEPLAKRQAEWAERTTDAQIKSVEAARRYAEQVERLQSVISSTREGLVDLFSGGKAGDFISNLKRDLVRLQAETTVESIFGDSLRQLERQARRNDPLNKEIANFTDEAAKGSQAIAEHAAALSDATARIKGIANDNPAPVDQGGTIVVNGARNLPVQLSQGSVNAFARSISQSIVNPALQHLDQLLGVDFFAVMSSVLSGVLEGYLRAGKVGGAIGGVKGIVDKLGEATKGQGKTGKALAEVSQKLGTALSGAQTGDTTAQLLRSIGIKTSRTGGQIGGAIGSLVPIPGGEIIGSIIGSVVGGLFKKTKRGSTTISNVDSDLAFSGSGSLKNGVLGLGGNVQSSIANIIESLGGTAGAFSVSVGQRGKKFVVDPSGRGRTKGSGVLKFKDEADAVRAAILDAIQDGAVQGIREGAQRLLRAGTDLDKALQKATKFQSIFDRLDAIKDPVGAALRSLNREFSGLRQIAIEAGEGLVELEELYGLERARVIEETSAQLTSTLRELLADLKTGDNGLDLRTRLSNALAVYNPLAETIRSGGTVDADKFADIARTVLDLQRQIDGSQSGYFSRFNEITGLTETALARQQAAIAAATGSGSPFSSNVPSNDNVVSAIGGQTAALLSGLGSRLDAINTNIGNLSLISQPFAVNGGAAYKIDGATYF